MTTPNAVSTAPSASLRISRNIPMAVKLAYTAFAALLIPVYLTHYGPTNFLYFCDQAVLLTLVGIWIESPLLISLCAVGILAPQVLWIVDFLGTAIGLPITGMTEYMFDGSKPLLLVWLVFRLGYDRRALPLWSVMAVATMLICFFLMPAPRPDAGLLPVNINYVWGFSDAVAQSWMPAWAWLAAMLIGLPALLFLPTHLVLRRAMPGAGGTRALSAA